LKYRTFTLHIEKREQGQTLFPAVLSSETPVERSFGMEILSHGPGEVNMTRARRGLPLLWNHNSSEVIGRVSNIRLTGDRKLRGELKPGTSARAEEIWRDVREGVIGDVSVGYEYGDNKPLQQKDGTYVFRNWQPLEVSLVSIPADAAAGIGRNISLERKKRKMKDNDFEDLDFDTSPKRTWGELENRRIQAIMNMCKANNIGRDLEQKMIADRDCTADRAGRVILEELKSRSYNTQKFTYQELGMSRSEVEKYSIARAISAAASNDWQHAGLEREASRAMSQKLGKQPQGFWIPTDVQLRTVSKGAGISTIATDVLAGSFIDLLRNKTVVLQAGATMLPALVGDIKIPRQSATIAAEWVAESSAPTSDDLTLDSVSMVPKTLAALTCYSRKMLLQSLPSIEGIITNDLARVIAVEIDRAAINGSGSGEEPKGLLVYTSGNGIGVVDCSGGLTWQKIIEFESTVAGANADLGNLAYITSPKVRGALKSTFTNSTYGEQPVWSRGADGRERVNGYAAFATANVPDTISTSKSGMIFGNFSDLLIGQWGALDLVVNPWGQTDFSKGDVSVRAMADVDIAVRHLESFAIAIDI
jgi:HK97 family phage major capsid protein/HK97 family phage prohead protease